MSRARLLVLRLVGVAMLVTLLGRLWFLQVVNGDAYVRAAADVRIRAWRCRPPGGRSSTWPAGPWSRTTPAPS
ncbi:hypothetical protein ACFQQB_01750 [Nonomuraea rubra]|uniref:hypothetical protein n=1 Tax=Nonomuraea rubra TaxID=46180 RepID=UPI00362001E9